MSDVGSVSSPASTVPAVAPESAAAVPTVEDPAAMRSRWLRVGAVVVATLLLLASSCSWQTGNPIP